LQLDPLLWLQAEGVPATLFPMGWWAQAFPEEMSTLAMLEFPIGSHGDVPMDLTGFSDEDLVTTVQDSYAHIRQITGLEPIPYFTPYAANMDERVRTIIARLGYLPVFWDVPADDWVAGSTPEQVYEHVVPNVGDGSIIEFHLDAPSSAESTAVVLPRIVSDLRERGFQFVTIPELAQPCAW
jgi:peptidoglycan/xylan/chitin deacetylase (PgdA/CDA1 family)